MEESEMVKLPTEMAQEGVQEGNEVFPCLPQGENSFRKSMENLNNKRDAEELQNSSVLQTEKNNIKSSVYRLRSNGRFKSWTFTPPPPTKFEEWCSERTGLSRLGLLINALVLLLMFICVISVIVMSCLWPTLPHSKLFPTCRTAACLVASSEILSKMNQTSNPCEDIREFSCGHWLATHSIPDDKYEWGLKQILQHKHREKIRDYLVTMPSTVDDEDFRWKVKVVYDSCMNFKSIEDARAVPLTNVIQELGGSKVIGTSGNPSDWKKLLKSLHKTFNIQPFFKIDVLPDPRESGASIIQISPADLVLGSRDNYLSPSGQTLKNEYRSYIKEMADKLGAQLSYASTYSGDVVSFEERLAERFPATLPDPPNVYRTTIGKLEDIAPRVPLYEILTSMFENVKLTKKNEVLITASDHLVNVSHIISSTGDSILHQYFIWRFITQYVPYLSQNYNKPYHEFYSKFYGFKQPLQRWEMCVTTLQKFFGYGIEALLENTHAEHDKKPKVVHEIFEHIRKTVQKSVENSRSLPRLVQDHFLEKINSLEMHVGLPPNRRNPSTIRSYYKHMIPVIDNFFQNVIRGVEFNLYQQKSRMTTSSEETNSPIEREKCTMKWLDAASSGELNVVYVPELNSVIVPHGLLTMPYFQTHYPLSILYGTLGVEMARSILASITGRGYFYSSHGILLDSDHPIRNLSRDCFLRHPTTTPYLEAVRLTHKALLKVLEKLPHVHQPGLEMLEEPELFFVAHAQSLCSMRSPQKKKKDKHLQHHDDSYMLNLLSRKSQQFSTAFSCTNNLEREPCDSLI